MACRSCGRYTGITQNVKDLLSSREVENIFENSDFVYMLNQAPGDRQILAKQLNISPHQLSYDEYRYDLDSIGHDPYVLISILTAYHLGTWIRSEVQGTLQMLFDRQYTLTQTVDVEVRYYSTDDGDIPYNYYICNVKLENFDLSHLPVYILSEDQLSAYSVYMANQGNWPDLFPVEQYPNASQREDYLDYDVPPEALAMNDC